MCCKQQCAVLLDAGSASAFLVAVLVSWWASASAMLWMVDSNDKLPSDCVDLHP
jgi:hypothetical protein